MVPTDLARQFEYMPLDDFEELLLDKPMDQKWELIGGRVIRGMIGARWEHHFIVQNVNLALSNHFRQRNMACRTYVETFWLKERSMNLAVFPDVIVRCGALPKGATHVSDPVVLIEVLSKGTQARDRHEKWTHYQKLPSLKHYVLIERDEPYVDVFSRAGETWSGFAALQGLDAVMRLPAIEFEMPLAEIYRDVIAA